MSVDARVRPAARPLWWAAVLVSIAGLFAMHGLGDHGTPADREMAGMSGAAAMSGPAVVAHVPARHGPSALAPASPSHAGHGMGALCLSVLVASLLAWTLSRRFHGPVQQPRSPRSVVPAATSWRDRDPPSLSRLSILRC